MNICKCSFKKSLLILLLCTFNIYGCDRTNNSTESKDTTPPVLYASSYNEFNLGEEIDVLPCTALDNVDGKISTTFEVISPSGLKVEITNNKFIASEIGVYKIIYKAVDSSGNENTIEVNVNVNEETIIRNKPQISVSDYDDNIFVGKYFSLPTIKAIVNVDGDLEYTVTLIDSNNNQEKILTNRIFFEYPGNYELVITSTNSANLSNTKNIILNVKDAEKIISGIDGLFDEKYENTGYKGRIGGSRELESADFYLNLSNEGINVLFDISNDKSINSNERIEMYYDSEGLSLHPTTKTTKMFYFYADGRLEYFTGNNASGWSFVDFSSLSYSQRPISKVKLLGSSTLESGNNDDEGWIAEAFIPYTLLETSKLESMYLSFGMVRENDKSNWDGWNDLGVYPDVMNPSKYAEFKNNKIYNTNRYYSMNNNHVNGLNDDEFYSLASCSKTTVGGLRNLEKANISLSRSTEGIYLYYDVPNDINVNNADRIEFYVHLGEKSHSLTGSRDFRFYMHASGNLQVARGSGEEIIPNKDMKVEYTSSLHEGTTIDDNDDTDKGYYGELFIPYSFFNFYSINKNVDSKTRFGITFGMWRTTKSYSSTDNWGTDPYKDWDGWNSVSFSTGFCDPLYPDTYAIWMYNGNIVSPADVIEEIDKPTDPTVDGKLAESYWTSEKTASLNIPRTGELDGVETLIYHDENGLRVAFKGDATTITKKDIIMFYINTYDQSYTIGSEILNDYYEVNGQYANTGDYMFRIDLDRSVQVKRGNYKDWHEEIKDLSKLQLEIDLESQLYSYVVELYIPYEFLSSKDHKVTKEDTLGFTTRLAGENSRGSVIWNNLHYAGIYCDSESPASYVRINKDGYVYAALDNSNEYMVDGKFDEEVYKSKYALVNIYDTTAKIYRSSKGIHIKYEYGANTNNVRLVLSTVNHGLGAPYVYDYQIITDKNGKLEFSWGNSHTFYDTSLYSPYSAPRYIVSEENGKIYGELFISYDYLSRYNTTGNYTEKGYMQIVESDLLRFSMDLNIKTVQNFTYNDVKVLDSDCDIPSTYRELNLVKEG